jgi:hypothetical protein
MLQGEAWSGVRELGGDRYELGGKVWERWGGEERGRAPVGDGGVDHQDV